MSGSISTQAAAQFFGCHPGKVVTGKYYLNKPLIRGCFDVGNTEKASEF